jgi:hypothetical protein
MKIHATHFLSRTTFCGLPLTWQINEKHVRQPMYNGKIIQTTKEMKTLTCNKCLRSCD